MKNFIVNGYVQVQTKLPDTVHDAVLSRSDDLFADTRDRESEFGRNPQNNIIPLIPELRRVLEAPEVVGALKSILGPRYLLHPHRHCHPNYPIAKESVKSEQNLSKVNLTMVPHKDGHANGAKPRHRVPRWAILFYYPQECPQEQGPTAIIPRSQYHNVLTRDLELEHPYFLKTQPPFAELAENGDFLLPESYIYRSILPLSSARGAVSIMHFDVGHSVLVNWLDRIRYGHKFVFMRTENPNEPSWNNQIKYWQTPELLDGTPDNEIVWTSVWNWLRGNPDRYACERTINASAESLIASLESNDDDMARTQSASEIGLRHIDSNSTKVKAANALSKALYDTYEPVRLNALYSLGAIGPEALPKLIPLLDEGAEFFEKNPVLNINHVVEAISGIGTEAIPSLVRALTSSKTHVRASVAYGLGEVGLDLPEVVEGLLKTVTDPVNAVKFHAISAIGMIGSSNKYVIDALLKIIARDPIDEEGVDGDPRVAVDDSQLKNVAVQALIRINANNASTIEVLADSVSRSDPYVAAFAGEQLRRIGTAEALSKLADSLSWSRWFPAKIRTRGDLKRFSKNSAKYGEVQRARAPVTNV